MVEIGDKYSVQQRGAEHAIEVPRPTITWLLAMHSEIKKLTN